jgi:hypothetical protein
MNGRLQIKSLSLKTPVVNPFSHTQCLHFAVYNVCPQCTPLLRFVLVIPVILLYRFPFPHLPSACTDFLSACAFVNDGNTFPILI